VESGGRLRVAERASLTLRSLLLQNITVSVETLGRLVVESVGLRGASVNISSGATLGASSLISCEPGSSISGAGQLSGSLYLLEPACLAR
jgi:hypothetical protein